VIGEMDLPSAKTLLYDGAIYLHRGVQFIVDRLDVANCRCYVEQADGNYFTEAVVKSELRILHRDLERESAGLFLLLGDILLRRQATKFKKLRYRTHENLGYGDIHLPPEEMHTRALVLCFPPDTTTGAWLAQCGEVQRSFIVDRLGVLVRNVAPVFLLCDPRDLGVATRLQDPELDCPAVYVYDAHPGGSGLAEGLHQQVAQVLAGCRELVAACECVAGCPSCIGPPAAQAPGGGGPDWGIAVAGNKQELLAVLQLLAPALPPAGGTGVAGGGAVDGAGRAAARRRLAAPHGAVPGAGAPVAVAPGRS
jgi:DEAD/DEAH box helicase domain-containing protein